MWNRTESAYFRGTVAMFFLCLWHNWRNSDTFCLAAYKLSEFPIFSEILNYLLLYTIKQCLAQWTRDFCSCFKGCISKRDVCLVFWHNNCAERILAISSKREREREGRRDNMYCHVASLKLTLCCDVCFRKTIISGQHDFKILKIRDKAYIISWLFFLPIRS